MSKSFQDETAIYEFLMARNVLKQAEARMEIAEKRLKETMGEREEIASETYGHILYKATKDTAKVDYKRMSEEFFVPSPEVIARFTTIVPGVRRLNARGLKQKED